MAISYLSEVVKSNPFIQPFSIDLMAKVNGYLQSQFYKNAQKVENMVGQLNNADIANEAQRNYTKNKINNLTNQISNMGALNYADVNVSNTLESYGSEIYGDPTVYNGISSTKRIRALQSNYEKMKTDPKLSKYYNPANEAFDSRGIIDYVNGDINSTYNGSTAPTIYKGNPYTRLMDAVKKIMPDVTVEFGESGNPFFIQQSTKKAVDPDKVYATISGSIDGDLLKQIQIDSWYNMRGLDSKSTLDLYKKDHTNKLLQLQNLKNFYTKKAETSALPSERADWENQKADIETRIKQVNDDFTPLKVEKQLSTQEGLEAVWYNLYRNRLFDDVIKSGSYTDESASKLIVNQQKIFEAKAQLQSIKEQAQKAKKSTEVGSSIQGLGELGYNLQNEEQAAAQNVNEKTYTEKNAALTSQNTQLITEFITTLAHEDNSYRSLLGEDVRVSGISSTTPITSTPAVLDVLRKLDGNASDISLDDLRYAAKYSVKTNSGNKFIENLDSFGINSKQSEFFKNIVDTWDGISSGKIDPIKLNELKLDRNKFTDLINKVNINRMAIGSNNAYVESVYNSVVNTNSLTTEEKMIYNTYLREGSPTANNKRDKIYQNPQSVQSVDKYYMQIGTQGKADTPIVEATSLGRKIQEIENRIGKQDVNKLFANDANRLNYFGAIISDKKALKEQGVILENYIGNSGNPNRPSDLGNLEDITPTDVRKDETTGQWVLAYQYKDKSGKVKFSDKETNYNIPPDLANKLQLPNVPYPELETAMRYRTESQPFYAYNKDLGQDGSFKFDIVRIGNDRNPTGFTLRFYDGDKTIPIRKGFYNEPFKTANSAFAFAQTIISPSVFGVSFNNNRSVFFERIQQQAY